MKPHSCLQHSRAALPLHFSAESGAPRQTSPRLLKHTFALVLFLLIAALFQQTIHAQAYPGYAPVPQYQQQPYYPQPQDAQQPQYGQQPQYPRQPQYPQQQPYADPSPDDQQYPQQAQTPNQGFAADQLEQLVAPIALYPDSLVAQILAASTYPAQVIAADNWLRSLGYATPDQIANGADAQADWDPSVKALTAFPQVLDLMNHDLRWTTDLGNAYYNQPQDVLQTIQVMRQRAEDAGTLQSTPQEAVYSNQGYIQIAPVNPQVVYVPTYNPWGVYGQPVSPYPGFSLIGALQSIAGSNVLRYGLSFAMSAFSHTPFGWAGWALNWLTSSIFFRQSPYYSQSTSVARWGNSGGGYYGSHGGGPNRTPNGYSRPEQSYNRSGNGYPQGNAYARGNGYGQPASPRPPVRTPGNYAYNRYDNRAAEAPSRAYAGNNVRPAQQNYAYARPQAPIAQPIRPQSYARPSESYARAGETYARPGAYGNSFYGNSTQAYAARPATPYAGQQTYRARASTYQRNDYAQRAYAEPKQERSSGSHMFGGGHGEEHYKAPKAPKAPKMSGGHHGSGLFSHHSR
jgi:hypothetical protein